MREKRLQHCSSRQRQFEQKGKLNGNEIWDNVQPVISELEERCLLNTEALVKQIVEAKLQGTDSGALAYLFHQTLAEQIVAACIEARNELWQE